MDTLKEHWEWTLLGIAGVMIILGFMFFGSTTGKRIIAENSPTPFPTADANKTPEPKPTWTTKPAMAIDTNKQYFAYLITNKGPIKIELFAKLAPETVNNFVFLTNQKFYNGLTFHRVIKDFMIQGGDPTGNGTGGPGYSFKDEINDEKIVKGTLAMANSGPNTNGSQFFIVTEKPQPHLDGKHTVFGKVVEGMDNVEAIAAVQTGPNDKPQDPIIIQQAFIEAK